MRMMKMMLAMGLSVAMLAGMNSCQKDASIPAPSIKFVDGNNAEIKVANLAADGNAYVEVTADAKTKLQSVTYLVKVTTVANEVKTVPTNGTPFTLAKTKTKSDVNGSEKATIFIGHDPDAVYGNKLDLSSLNGVQIQKLAITIVATDKNGGVTTRVFDAKWNAGAVPTPGTSEGTQLGAEQEGGFSNLYGAGKGGFDLDKNETVSVADAALAKNCHMINISKAKSTEEFEWIPGFTSSSVEFWNNKGKETRQGNGTEFVKVTDAYATFTTVEAVKKAFEAGSATKGADRVAEGDVYVAKFNSTYYVINITKVAADVNYTREKKGNTGHIAFKFKKGSTK